MQPAGNSNATSRPPSGVDRHCDDRGDVDGHKVAPARIAAGASTAASPTIPTRPMGRQGGTGLRLTLRSTLNVPASIHSGCSYSTSSGTATPTGWDPVVMDPLEQQFAAVKQCICDCREALLLAREWARMNDGALACSSSLSHAPQHTESGMPQEGVFPSQEGVSMRLLRAVMDFENACATRDACPPQEQHSRTACENGGDGLVARDLVRAQAMCLLRQHHAARRTASGDGAHIGGKGSNSGGDGFSGATSSHAVVSSSISEARECSEEDEGDPLVTRLPAFLRFRHLFSRDYAKRTAAVAGTVSPAPLLVEQARYASLIADMGTLSRHLLLPLDVVRHHERLWLFTQEDVKYSLEEQLYHYRVVLSSHTTQGGAAGARRGMPEEGVRKLWAQLWEVLGAAWRQRERLLGAFRHAMPPALVEARSLTGQGAHHARTRAEGAPEQPSPGEEESPRAMALTSTTALPPFMLPPLRINNRSNNASSGAACHREASLKADEGASQASLPALTAAIVAVPPPVSASPYRKERYARHVTRFWRTQASECLRRENAKRRAGRMQEATSSSLPMAESNEPTPRSPLPLPCHSDAQDLFRTQVYAAEDGLGMGPFTPAKIGLLLDGGVDFTSTTGGSSGPRYVVRDVLEGVWRAMRCALPSNSEEAVLACAPFFDVSAEDVSAGAAVPYMSPEVYTELCQTRAHARTTGGNSGDGHGCVKLAIHSFSDDAWNVAVMVLEACLTGFPLADSHLMQGKVDGTATTATPYEWRPSASVYGDVLTLLTQRHGLPLEAAHNFLYATLHHVPHMVDSVLQEGPVPFAETSQDVRPNPERMAAEWVQHLLRQYGAGFVRTVVQEVCTTGLCWRRADRWTAFCSAHAPSAGGDGRNGGEAPATATGEEASPLTARMGPSSVAHEPLTPTSPSSPSFRSDSHPAHGEAGHALRNHKDSNVPDVLNSFSLDTAAATLSDMALYGSQMNSSVATPPTPVVMRRSLTSAPTTSSPPKRAAVSSTSAHTQKLTDRSEGQLRLLQTPLLPVLPGSTCHTKLTPTEATTAEEEGGAAWPASELWPRLVRWSRLVERAAVHAGGSHGAVGPQRQSIRFTELVRLGREAIMLSLDNGKGSKQPPVNREDMRYAVAEHPFIRGVIERGQLPAYAALIPHSGAFPTPLSTPSLFIPLRDLRTLFARVDVSAQQARRAHALGVSSPIASNASFGKAPFLSHSFSFSFAERPGSPRPPPQPQRVGSLQVLLGDTKRIRPANAQLRSDGGSWSGLRHSSPSAGPARGLSVVRTGAVKDSSTASEAMTLRAAAWGLTREVDVNMALQLHITSHLRRLLLTSASSPQATATAVRRYLVQLHEEMGVCLVPVPATMRGDVWGALLGVPSPRKREALYASLGTAHRTLADRQIAVDTPRCHQYHPLLATEEGQAQLQRVLKAWLVMPRDPPLSYWQGLDSVCAVLLTASYTDEPLVLAQLDAVIRLLAAHQDAAATTSKQKMSQPQPEVPTRLRSPTCRLIPSSMGDALRQFSVTLRYCDPLLATHIFGLDCPPQLFAISWLLTLFAHNLPARQVYLLWDFLFLYAQDSPHCLSCMCCAFLLQKRVRIMGQDASGVLAALGSGGGGSQGARGEAEGHRAGARTDVVSVLADTALLMRVVPACIGHQPEEGTAFSADNHAPNHPTSVPWQVVLRTSEVAFMDVSTLLAALRPQASRASPETRKPRPWWNAGLYLVDIRDRSHARTGKVLGALSLPIAAPSQPSSRQLRPEQHSAAEDVGDSPPPKPPTSPATTAHIHRHDDMAFKRSVAEVASELMRQLRNPTVATLPPLPESTFGLNSSLQATPTPETSAGCLGVDRTPEPSPIAWKASRSPHVVLLTSAASPTRDRNGLGAYSVAHALALELTRCGAHNVSILLGGVELLQAHEPSLVVVG